MQYHNIPPLFDENSKVLILGSFPSVKSREQQFFYGHPQNRFWKTLAAVFSDNTPRTVDEKRKFILKHNLALWDVIKSCDIVGSSDSSIKNVTPNDILMILRNSQVNKIYTNGKTSFKLYNKYILPVINIEAECLPSTSPANAAFSLEKLIDDWRQIKKL